jgi:hypothetical protein
MARQRAVGAWELLLFGYKNGCGGAALTEEVKGYGAVG